MDSKVTRCEQNLHEMDPCAKKCPPVKSIGFTGEPPGHSWFRIMAHMEFWPSEIPKFEDAKLIFGKIQLSIRFPAFDTSPRQENIKL